MFFTIILFIGAIVLALAAGMAAYLWWQASGETASFDEMFAVRESDPVRVGRKPEAWTLTASDGRNPVAIRVGTAPDALDPAQAVIAVDGRCHAPAAPDPLQRYFFAVEFDDGQVFHTSERFLPFEGAWNFRDLGGYRTTGGQRIAWGRVYRSSHLNELTDDDLALVQALGIRLVCDLRRPPGMAARPDRLPDGVEHRPMPVFVKEPIGKLRMMFAQRWIDRIFKRVYRTNIIDGGAPVIGTLLRLIADPANLPLVFHCAGGKDRTGIPAALLLHLCGVPRETIIADYTLTNIPNQRYITGILNAPDQPLSRLGLKIERLFPMISARSELIEYAFAHIEATYGTPDAYLRGPVGLAEDDIQAIRSNLLE